MIVDVNFSDDSVCLYEVWVVDVVILSSIEYSMGRDMNSVCYFKLPYIVVDR